jgi:catechol 2,3-dioxygenase-like lactoylglutathione lyase family enzyme
MIKTYGLTHTALRVRDLDRTIAFYGALFGMRVLHRGKNGADIGTPGSNDVMSILPAEDDKVGDMGHLGHIGFRLQAPEDIEAIAGAVEAAGGVVKEKGHFTPDEPYVFATDPDGYVLEIWYEPEQEARNQ